ncbi:MAG: hypothetical protein JWM56_700 [Candidatus Peribacteria bacterium]|nr:hypothetical protein [Candidatus Peribacteria bacterium]
MDATLSVSADSGTEKTPEFLQKFWTLSRQMDIAVREKNSELQETLNLELIRMFSGFTDEQKAEIMTILEQEGVYERLSYKRSGTRKAILALTHGTAQVLSDVADFIPPLAGKTVEVILKTLRAIYLSAKKAFSKAA